MRFVHDVDAIAARLAGGVARALAQVARVVHAAVRGRIDLDDIERRGPAPDALAARALAARLAVGTPVLAVQRMREHARERRLAHAAGPAEEVRVRDAVPRDRTLERVRDVLLHGDVGEALRAVLPGETEVGH